MVHLIEGPYTATDEGSGVTEASLATWLGTRALFGKFVEVRLAPVCESEGCVYACSDAGEQIMPTMVLVDGLGRTLALNGVTCGFDGTGPRGAARILAEEGFLNHDSAQMVATTCTQFVMRR